VEDYRRAQTFADRFASLDWVGRLDRWARAVNPLLRELLAPMTYYWVTAQAEYATDIVFKSPRHLQDLMPRLLEHSTLHFGAKDVLSFLGRKFHGNFQGEVVTDRFDPLLRGRLPGCRVKHRMKQNWLKMYDKAGFVLRVETVINQPEEFRVRSAAQTGSQHPLRNILGAPGPDQVNLPDVEVQAARSNFGARAERSVVDLRDGEFDQRLRFADPFVGRGILQLARQDLAGEHRVVAQERQRAGSVSGGQTTYVARASWIAIAASAGAISL